MSDFTNLIERLEAAGEGSRELDAEIWFIIEPQYLYQTDREGRWYHNRTGTVLTPVWTPDVGPRGAPHCTTSLDAVLPWENITEMTWHEVVEGEALGEVCEAWHEDRKTGKRTLGQGNTEPLARRIAALRARSGP